MGGEFRREAFQKFAAGSVQLSGGIRTKKSLDAVDLTAETKSSLDGGNIGDGKVIIGTEEIGGGFKKKTDAKVGPMSSGYSAQGVPDFQLKAIREGSGEGDSVGFGNNRDCIGRGAKRVLQPVGHQFVVREGIDTHQMQELARVRGERGYEGDRGSDFPDARVLPKNGDKVFRKPEALPLDGKIGSAGHKVEGGAEGAEGCLINRLDGHDGGHAHGEGEQIKKGEGFVPEKITAAMGQKNAKRGKPVQG